VSINYSINVNINAGALRQNINASNITNTFATAGLLAVTLDVGTSTTAINTASAGVLGLCFARSLVADTTGTHTVSFGRLDSGTLYDAARLLPGDAALLRLAPGDYAAQSSAEGGRLLLQILEE
jgi:hypothetical protein